MSVETLHRSANLPFDPTDQSLFGPGLKCVQMSYGQYLRLPEKPKAEWFDGWVVIHVAPSAPPHANMHYRLITRLGNAFPKHEGSADGPIQRHRFRLYPDIMLFDPDRPRSLKSGQVEPVLAVESLSPSTQKYDLTVKAAEYLKADIRQYWTVDTKRQTIVVRENVGKGLRKHWRELATLDADHPVITVDLLPYGSITLDRAALFRDLGF